MFRPLPAKLRIQRWALNSFYKICLNVIYVCMYVLYSLTKDPANYRGSRTGNAANHLELKVLTHIQYVPWKGFKDLELRSAETKNMVYTNRIEKYSTSQESNSIKSSTSRLKYPTSYGVNSNLNSNSSIATNNSWSRSAVDNEKWKYNNMVSDDRDKFNGMHFC